jgi:hypothetical protein
MRISSSSSGSQGIKEIASADSLKSSKQNSVGSVNSSESELKSEILRLLKSDDEKDLKRLDEIMQRLKSPNRITNFKDK